MMKCFKSDQVTTVTAKNHILYYVFKKIKNFKSLDARTRKNGHSVTKYRKGA